MPDRSASLLRDDNCLGLDLDLPARVEELRDDSRAGRTRVCERLVVRATDGVEVLGLRDVDARAHDLVERGARLAERERDAPDAGARLLGGVVGRIDASRGDLERVFPWASVTKLASAVAVLVAAEEGIVDLDEPAGPPGSTVRHLLAHASGLPFDPGPPIARPGTRRIYSNYGFEVLAAHVGERAEMPFAAYFGHVWGFPLEGDAGS